MELEENAKSEPSTDHFKTEKSSLAKRTLRCIIKTCFSSTEKPAGPDQESVRLALRLSWEDHKNTRLQTWRALQIEAVLAAGLVGVEWQINKDLATLAVAILVMVAAYFGGQIAIHHRNDIMRQNFKNIKNLEKHLRILGPNFIDLTPPDEAPPNEFETINLRKALWPFSGHNTSLYILRMHITIFFFALVFFLNISWPVIKNRIMVDIGRNRSPAPLPYAAILHCRVSGSSVWE